MEKVGNHNSISRKIFFSITLMLFFSFSSFAQDSAPAEDVSATSADPVKGKELFNSNCAACHKLDGKATGPELRGVASKYDASWLHKWVRNSSDLIKSGDAQAVKVFEDNNKAVMSSFPQLTDADIDNILAYTSEPKLEAPVTVTAGVQAVPGAVSSEDGISNNIILGALALVMLILIVMLYLVNNILSKEEIQKHFNL